MASRMVTSVFFGMIENGKQAISFGVFTQSESATQWIFADEEKMDRFNRGKIESPVQSYPLLVQEIEPLQSHLSNH